MLIQPVNQPTDGRCHKYHRSDRTFITVALMEEAISVIHCAMESSYRSRIPAGFNTEYVRLEVNPTTKCLLVVPTHSSDKDSIRWIKGQKEQSIRNMESRIFGDELYKAWGLDPE